MNKKDLPPFTATHPGEYNLDTATIAERDNQRETVSITIPVRDRNLLRERFS